MNRKIYHGKQSVQSTTTTTKSCRQCDHIGRFLKLVGNKFDYKSSTKSLLIFGIFWKRSINVKMLWIFFRQLVDTFGQLFSSTSRHTACGVQMRGKCIQRNFGLSHGLVEAPTKKWLLQKPFQSKLLKVGERPQRKGHNLMRIKEEGQWLWLSW